MTMRMTVVKNLVFGLPGEGEVVVDGSQVCHAEEAGEVISMTARMTVVKKLVLGLAGAVGVVVEGCQVRQAGEAGT
jgi:hypothetical protein